MFEAARSLRHPAPDFGLQCCRWATASTRRFDDVRLSFATIFIAQAYGIELSAGTQVAILLTLMLSSRDRRRATATWW